MQGQEFRDDPLYDETTHTENGRDDNPILSYSLSGCKNDLGPATLKRKLIWYRHLRTTTATAA